MEYWALLLCLWGVFALQAVALNVVVGEMGLLSLCHAGFFGVGAYTVALLSVKADLSPVLASMLAPIVVAVIAGLLALPLHRLTGDFFAIATFGLALVFFGVAQNWTEVTGGTFGIAAPLAMPGSRLAVRPASTLVIPVWLAVAVVLLVAAGWRRSPLGRVLNAIREDEVLARSLAKPVRRHRLIAFTWSAAVAGLAGVFYMWLFSLVDPSGFGVMESVMLVAMIVIGGAGSNAGSVLGAGLVVLAPEALRFLGLQGRDAANLRQILFGLLLYLVLCFRPQGILGRLKVGLERRA